METINQHDELGPVDDKAAVEAMFNQAVQEGTLDAQRATLNAMANEVGTTVDALSTAREQRNQAAAARLAGLKGEQHPSTFVGNSHDHWMAKK